MKINDLSDEIITFWVPDAPSKSVNLDCETCNGKGIDKESKNTCTMCKGSGKEISKTTISESPEFDILFDDAIIIFNLLDINYNDTLMGSIDYTDIGNIKQHILKLINSDDILRYVKRYIFNNNKFYISNTETTKIIQKTNEIKTQLSKLSPILNYAQTIKHDIIYF